MSLTLSQDDMNEVSAAIAHIIAGLPAPQGAATLSTFCMPLVEGLHNVAIRKQAPTKQVQQNVSGLPFTFSCCLSCALTHWLPFYFHFYFYFLKKKRSLGAP